MVGVSEHGWASCADPGASAYRILASHLDDRLCRRFAVCSLCLGLAVRSDDVWRMLRCVDW